MIFGFLIILAIIVAVVVIIFSSKNSINQHRRFQKYDHQSKDKNDKDI